MNKEVLFDGQAVCDVCCGQNGKGAFDYTGDYICYDCAISFDADIHNNQVQKDAQGS